MNRSELLSQLRQMDEYEFEELVADVWQKRGWETTVTTGSSDRGIDVIAEKSSPFSQKQLIQAKRYSASNKIGSPDVQQYSSLRDQEDDTDAVVIVTTSSFSRQAKEIANDLNVKLIDGDDFYEVLNGKEDIFGDYIEFTSTQENVQGEIPNTDEIFEVLYIDLVQDVIAGEISSENIEEKKRDLFREQSLRCWIASGLRMMLLCRFWR